MARHRLFCSASSSRCGRRSPPRTRRPSGPRGGASSTRARPARVRRPDRARPSGPASTRSRSRAGDRARRRAAPAARSRPRPRRHARRDSRSRPPAGRRPSPRSGRCRTTREARWSAGTGRRRGERRAARRGAPRRGSGPGPPTPRRPRPGAELVDQLAAPATTRWTPSPSSARASIATSRRLKWCARSSVATNAATAASPGIPRRSRSRRRPAGREQLGVDPVRHLHELLGTRSPARRRYGTESRVVGREHADAVGGADQRRRHRALVHLEQRAPAPLPTSRFL